MDARLVTGCPDGAHSAACEDVGAGLFCLLTALAVLVAVSVAFLLMLAPWQRDLRIAAEGIGILIVTWFAVWLYQGYVAKRHKGLNATSDALANFIDVFHPEQARSQRALREVHSKTIAPTPDDEDDPVRLVTNRDETPRAVRIHRRASTSAHRQVSATGQPACEDVR